MQPARLWIALARSSVALQFLATARSSSVFLGHERCVPRESPDRRIPLCAIAWGVSLFPAAPLRRESGSRKCAMQLKRARRLSSERTMCHGASLVSVTSSIMSRAWEYAYQRAYDSRSIGLSFHCRIGSSIRASNRFSCSSWPTSSQNLIRMIPDLRKKLSPLGQFSKKVFVLLLRAESHDVFHPSAVVPAPVEDQQPHRLPGKC